MKESYVNLINIRRRVFAEIARIAYDDVDIKELESASYRIIPGEVASYRESVFRERAIVDERLRFTMGLHSRPQDKYRNITEGIESVDIEKRVFNEPLVEVIPFACEACPEKEHLVTDNCRKCLAHPCSNVCPVNAITIGKKSAIIDHEKCINCGRCKDTCPYHAIIETGRPCASACGVDAIESDYLNRAFINSEKCVACGACIVQCPFGAISDKSEIYQLIKTIKSGKNVYGIIAPSFVGQFGPLVSPAQAIEGIKQLGFKDVFEVSLGADITTINEAKEYLEKVPGEYNYMGTSCCFSWSLMVKKNFPEEYHKISNSSSPMAYTAKYIKEKCKDEDAVICFIGPCISKKLEAMKEELKDTVNFVITFEELIGMFVAKNIELTDIEVDKNVDDASKLGRGYAIAGGVQEAVKEVALRLNPDADIKVERADTLKECKKMMKMAQKGLKNGYLLEGMACSGGCIGGPGTIASMNRVRKSVQKFMDEADAETPLENKKIIE